MKFYIWQENATGLVFFDESEFLERIKEIIEKAKSENDSTFEITIL